MRQTTVRLRVLLKACTHRNSGHVAGGHSDCSSARGDSSNLRCTASPIPSRRSFTWAKVRALSSLSFFHSLFALCSPIHSHSWFPVSVVEYWLARLWDEKEEALRRDAFKAAYGYYLQGTHVI